MAICCAQEKEVPDVPKEVKLLPNTFKEDYKSKAYDYVETKSSLARFGNWLKDKFSGSFDSGGESAGAIFIVLYYLFWFAVVLLVIFLVVKFVLNKEIRWIFKRNKEEVSVSILMLERT